MANDQYISLIDQKQDYLLNHKYHKQLKLNQHILH
jgi:hypothetical protein